MRPCSTEFQRANYICEKKEIKNIPIQCGWLSLVRTGHGNLDSLFLGVESKYCSIHGSFFCQTTGTWSLKPTSLIEQSSESTQSYDLMVGSNSSVDQLDPVSHCVNHWTQVFWDQVTCLRSHSYSWLHPDHGGFGQVPSCGVVREDTESELQEALPQWPVMVTREDASLPGLPVPVTVTSLCPGQFALQVWWDESLRK